MRSLTDLELDAVSGGLTTYPGSTYPRFRDEFGFPATPPKYRDQEPPVDPIVD